MNDARKDSLPDVRLLKSQDLPGLDFPGGRNQDFRVHISPDVHKALWTHATEDTSVEICGVLVGKWGRDASGPFVTISESIRGQAAESKLAEVTFTHDTWSKINAEMDSKFGHLSIVGWYHTHPDFGIFLSDRDRFIHEHFFSGPGQVALVIDPIRKLEGVFVWKEGKTALTPHFWIGDRLEVPPSNNAEDRKPAQRGSTADPATGTAPAQAVGPVEPFWIRSLNRVLMALCLFLLGYLASSYISGFFNSWEKQLFLEGVVSHYGIWAGLRPGLKDNQDRLDGDMQTVVDDIKVLRDDHLTRLDPAKDREAFKRWEEVVSLLLRSKNRVGDLESVYCFADEEQKKMIRRQILDRLESLNRPAERLTPYPGDRDILRGLELVAPPSSSSSSSRPPEPTGKPAANASKSK